MKICTNAKLFKYKVYLILDCPTKANMGLEWYQSTAYDFPISRLVFF
jgi:hypothetical protein